MELNKPENKIHEFPIKRGHLLALHQNIRTIIDNDIPSSKEDIGLLLELLTDISKQDKDTKKEITLKLKTKQLKPSWHCCNIILQNEMQKDHIHAEETMWIMSLIAQKIDALAQMEVKPSLTLLEGGIK